MSNSVAGLKCIDVTKPKMVMIKLAENSLKFSMEWTSESNTVQNENEKIKLFEWKKVCYSH